ncbi:ABC transporter permease [Brevibacillus sp. NRS-1366]|uniref:ABC transporter permease n=1 Tax=Brevibacillus sp. NRS-1366 TaxID=3233899 RepID=UPI003D1CB96C
MKSLRDEFSHLFKGKFITLAILVPLIVAAVFGFIFSKNQITEGNLAVIDQDNSLYSRQLIDRLDASQYVNVAAVFLHAVKPDELLYNEKFMGVIYIPQGLEQNRYKGIQSTIGLFVDNANATAVGTLRNGVAEVITTENIGSSMGRLKAMGMNDEQVNATVSSVSLQQRLLFNPTTDPINSSVIGYVMLICLAIYTFQCLQIVPRLRVEGRLQEELANPIGLMSRVVPYALVGTIGIFFSLGVLKVVGSFRFTGNPLEFLLPLFLYSLVAGLLPMLITWNVPTPAKASFRVTLFLLPSMLLGGVQAPVAMLPTVLQIVGKAIPFTWLFSFIRGMGLRGGDLFYFQKEIGALLLYAGILVVLLIFCMLREQRKLRQEGEKNEETLPGNVLV